MAKASKLARQLQRILREEGELPPGETGPNVINIVAAADRRAADGKKPQGRKFDPPRLVVVGRTVKIRHAGKDKTTHIVVKAGMDARQIELAANAKLMDFKDELDAKDRGEVACEDTDLKPIVDKWIGDHAASASKSLNEARERFGRHLDKHFPVKRLGNVLWSSGNEYIKGLVEDVEDEDKRETLHNTAIERLNMLATAIEYYYASLTVQPDRRRTFEIPSKIKRKSGLSLTWDQLMRLLKAAEGWRWDPETGWIEDYDPDLVVVGRYALIYFYSGTRDKTILPLKWGTSSEGGCIDAAKGIIYRKPSGARKTHKRAEPAHLLGTLKEKVKEWEREDSAHGWDNVLHDTSGNEIANVKTRFDKVKAKAGLDWMRAHDLKHSGVSILTHAGLDINVLASAMSTTAETLRREYTHLDFLYLKPKKTTRRGLDLSLEALRKCSPPSREEWKKRAARRTAAKVRQLAARRIRDGENRAAARAAAQPAAPETGDARIGA
ncbi:hypothetical protein [Bradyrhizobium iriomotense]|uniref:hypothetical protein n=1 Tax=Bradyrhizobium iriomotense TaxID=441950 RepID=UPI001B89F29D|nr:hypothetical protein [Bradyrhizobium iriomotense]MBR1133293.1 hypothetical protein [Bradyrhizobium iriomotense]